MYIYIIIIYVYMLYIMLQEVVPLYFRQSRLSSFKRQLNLYGFNLVNSGAFRGAYYHELFQKDRPELCRRMRRVAVKVGTTNKAVTAASTTSSSSEKQTEHEEQEKGGPSSSSSSSS